MNSWTYFLYGLNNSLLPDKTEKVWLEGVPITSNKHSFKKWCIYQYHQRMVFCGKIQESITQSLRLILRSHIPHVEIF